jgi:Tfp pilus assembly protein PilV
MEKKSSSGLTLIELSVAMLVFLVGVLGLLQLVVLGVGLNQRSRDTALATSLAQAKADELLRQDFLDPSLARGGIIPLKPETHPFVSNPAPVSGYADFFDYDGKTVTTTPVPIGTALTKPAAAYFVRQWQVWSCNCGGAGSSCTSTCAPAPSGDLLKKVTVTVTSISPAFQGSFPSATVVFYKSRIN